MDNLIDEFEQVSGASEEEELQPKLGRPEAVSGGARGPGATITDKEFYKAMQKLKDRGTNAVPPKKSASAYILFGKEVSAELIRC